ncbi:MAG: ABC transporter ATP-binding protein [Propionibacteriaceae bacterium]|nr:ABC transporter ATP-binding protein [Propionibacteriaceae bacterium]
MSDAYIKTDFDSAQAKFTYRKILAPIFRLIPFIGAFKGLFAITLVTMVLYHLCAVLVSASSAWIITRTVAAGGSSAGVVSIFVCLGAAILGAGVFMWLNSWYAHLLSYKIIARLRINVYDAVARINPAGLQKRRTGDLATATMADLEATEWFYAHTIADVIASVFTSALLTVPLVAVLGLEGMVPLAGAWLILALPLLTLPIQMRQGVRLRGNLSHLKAGALEGIQGMRDIVCLGLTEQLVRETQRNTDRVQRSQRSYAVRSGLEKSTEDVVATLVTIGMLLIMLRQYTAGQIPLLIIPIIQVGISAVLRVVISVAGMLRKLGEIAAASARFLLINDAPATVLDANDPRPMTGLANPTIRFDDVHFAYPEGDPVLRGVNLEIPAGSTVALVGQSGSGKSTLASLLLRLWDVDRGAILLGGHDIRQVARDDLRRCVTLVSQNPYVFRGTICYNLALGRPDATREQMWTALESARMRELVESFPQGLDAPLGERASNLSGGQKQRLNLAQAFLRDSPVVVMDEAVSHLDPELEHELNTATSHLRKGRTTLIIAHRLSTIEQADLIAFLDGGVIVQVGTHQDLVETNPRYVEILANQLRPQDEISAEISEDARGEVQKHGYQDY